MNTESSGPDRRVPRGPLRRGSGVVSSDVSALRSVFDGCRDAIVVTLDDTRALPVRLCLSPHCTTLASSGRCVRPSSPTRPRFLTARLRDPAPSFAEQVDEIRATRPEQVSAEIRTMFTKGDVPAVYTSFVNEPAVALDRLCRTLTAYWDQVVRPSWGTIRVFLEREILNQGYRLATRPARVALNQVHPAISVTGNELHLARVPRHDRTRADGRELLLTPLATSRAGLFADLDGPGRIKIGYGAPGAHALWADRRDGLSRCAALAGLLGARRAAVLDALAQRTTTTMLAAELHAAPATISAHLGFLARVGLVERVRVGHNVYYQHSDRGDALVALFQDAAG
jgi:DNA-binding transcriptional ArsR family regulator